ncbi:MAG: hypothetical protein AAB209_09400, partial [Bacteroidota bacterium]
MSSPLIRICSLIIVLLTFVVPLNAQLQSNISLPDLLKMRPDVKPDASQISVKSVPLDAPVDPAEYYVGSGDVFVLNVWSSMPVEHQVTVTPEATLLIPNVGVLDVREQ